VDLRQHFGRNLRDVRQARELTQEQLGFLAGLDRTEISLLERGGREPRLATLIKLAGALGVGPEDLSRGIRWLPAKAEFRLDSGEPESPKGKSGHRKGQSGKR
jgi:transcriptional regulator with XRE-family HTH domain